jgi:hypothetical protein
MIAVGDEIVAIEAVPPMSKNARKKLLKKEATEKKKTARAIAKVS